MNPSRYSNRELYRRVFAEARAYRWHIIGLLCLSLLGTPIALLTPLPLKIAVDSVIGDEPLPGFIQAVLPDTWLPGALSDGAILLFAVGLSLGTVVLGKLRSLINAMLRTYTGEKLVLEFRARLFRHAQRLSLAYHDTQGTFDTSYRVQYDAPAVQWIAIDGIIPFITSAVTLFSMLYVTARISPQLALVAMAVSPLLYLISRLYSRRLRREWRGAKKIESASLSVVQEVLNAVRVVKAFGQEEREQDRFVRQAHQSLRAKIKLAFVESGLGLLIAVTTAIGTAAVLYIGVRQVQAGTLSLGNLLLVMGYLSQLYKPLETMSHRVASLQSSLASAERAFTLLDEMPNVEEKPDAKPLDRARGAVLFEHVSFCYEGDARVLHDITFDVAAGTRVGIAGTTGAGKTTLMSLVTRFYDPDEGRILLDGVDLRDYKLRDLRNQFAIVLQEPVLFSTSIAENIAYARPSATDDEIIEAAKAANAHDFIMNLPQGYQTPVGERGMKLSGGERQRISLARAFLKDAPILILDEPTSSVDINTEALIMEAMERLMKGRTTFMIAHRLSTLDYCDMRLRIEGGRLVEVRQPEDEREVEVVTATAPNGL